MAGSRTDLAISSDCSTSGAFPRPGAIWRSALTMLRGHLEAQGLSPERALELGEGAVVASALRYIPRSVEEACELALRTIGRL
jgi:hypothetical protein